MAPERGTSLLASKMHSPRSPLAQPVYTQLPSYSIQGTALLCSNLLHPLASAIFHSHPITSKRLILKHPPSNKPHSLSAIRNPLSPPSPTPKTITLLHSSSSASERRRRINQCTLFQAGQIIHRFRNPYLTPHFSQLQSVLRMARVKTPYGCI